MDKELTIREKTDLPALNIAIDTIDINKQALVFCNTKRTAESTAEKLSMQIKNPTKELDEFLNNGSKEFVKVLEITYNKCKNLV